MGSRSVLAAVLAVAVLTAGACSAGDPAPGGDAASGPPTGGAPATTEAAGTAAASGPEPIVIGAVMATSGLQAPVDGPALHALRYAVAQVNAAGGLMGRPLELRIFDAESELNVVYRAALRLAEQGAPVIFATCDPYFARPAMEVGAERGVLVIAPCGPEPLVGGIFVRPMAFAATASAADYGRAMAEHLVDRGIRSVALLTESDDLEAVRMCEAFRVRFAESGGLAGFALSFDRAWLAGQAAVGRRATARSLEPASSFPTAVLCAGIGGRGIEFFRLMRGVGVTVPVLAPAALDGVTWRALTPLVEPLAVVTTASTYGDDPSEQVNAYFASLALGRGSGGDGPQPVVEDRLGWAVTGAEGLWLFIRAVQRTGSTDPRVLAADLERFDQVELWAGAASLGPDQHAVGGRALRIVEHFGGAGRLLEVRRPSEPAAPGAQ